MKRLLTSTAEPMPLADPIGRGSGQLSAKAAVEAATPAYTQAHPASLGTGSLEKSRGTAHVADPVNGAELIGEKDIMGQAWKAPTWAAAASAGTAWSGGTWNGRSWTGSAWTGSAWAGSAWTGRS